MKRFSIPTALFAAIPLALAACAVDAPDETGVSRGAIQESNGREMNGREMNGREMNGREMNGREMNGKSAGVWYAKRFGATIIDPLVNVASMASRGARAAGPNLPGRTFIGFGGTTNPLQTIALEHGQLVGVRPNGARVQGTAFRDIYLVGRGPTPAPTPGLGVGTVGTLGTVGTVATFGTVGTLGTVGTVGTLGTIGTMGTAGTLGTIATTTTTATGVTPAQTTADKIRAYVARRLAETNVPERDVSLHVVAAVPNAPANAFHNYTPSARWHYRVEVKDDDGVYRPFCGTNADGSERLAIALPDRFNYAQGLNRTVTIRDHGPNGTTTTTRTDRGGALVTDPGAFTFACDNAAVSKCVERLKYDPEQTIEQVSSAPASFAVGQPARDLLQSCVRMFRADFCGNGLSMTLDGTAIDVADSALVNLPTQFSSEENHDWSLEASWRPDGATCAQKERQVCVPTGEGQLARMFVREYIDAICPGTIDSVSDSDDHWCKASHYMAGLPGGPFGSWPGGGGGGLTTGGSHLSASPTLTPQQINTGGGGGSVYNEWDVIWTTTKASNECLTARRLGDLAAVEIVSISR